MAFGPKTIFMKKLMH